MVQIRYYKNEQIKYNIDYNNQTVQIEVNDNKIELPLDFIIDISKQEIKNRIGLLIDHL